MKDKRSISGDFQCHNITTGVNPFIISGAFSSKFIRALLNLFQGAQAR
jgi:hypothetical protein